MMSATRIRAMLFKLLMSICLIFNVEAQLLDLRQQNCSDHYKFYEDLSSFISPKLYNVMLRLKTNTTFDGKSTVSFDLLQQTDRILFHIYELQIDDLIVDITNSKHKHKSPNYNYCPETQTLAVIFHEALTPGEYSMDFEFHGYLIGRQGFVAIECEDNKGGSKYNYITLFEPIGARRAFPCWDLPEMKAQFNISIVHLNKYRATSITPAEKEIIMGFKTTKTMFQLTPKIPTYLLTIILTDDIRASIKSDNLTVLSRPQIMDRMEYVLDIGTQILRLFAEAKFEDLSIKMMACPNLPVKAVGGGSLFIYREADLIYNETSDFPGRKLDIRKTISQEFMYLWLKNFANESHINQMWFNKALAFYMGYVIVEENLLMEHIRMMELFVVQILQPALHNDVVLRVPPVASAYDPFYFTHIYKKAAILFRMVENMVTTKMFWKNILVYMEQSQHKMFTPNDFWKNFLHILLDKNLKIPDTIKRIMDTWLSHQYYPKVYVDKPKDSTTIYYKQEPFVKPQNGNKTRWFIPISMVKASSPIDISSANKTTSYLMRDNIAESMPQSWYIFNIFQTGFYRVNYNTLTWRKFTNFLKTSDYYKIPPVNRAQLIDDAYHFSLEKQLDSSIFFEIIQYLRYETDYIPWHTMFNLLHYMSPYFELPESHTDKMNLLELLDGLLKNIGYEEYNIIDENNMMKAFRLLAMKWACRLGHNECLEKTNAKLLAHLEKPENNPILPWWKDWMYCTGMRKADFDTWKIMVDLFFDTDDTKFLEYMTCVDSLEILNDYFFYEDKNSGGELWNKIDSIHHVQIYNSILKKHAKKNELITTALHRFNRTNYGHSSQYERMIYLIMSIYDKIHFDKVLDIAMRIIPDDHSNIRHFVLLRWAQLDKYSSTFPKN